MKPAFEAGFNGGCMTRIFVAALAVVVFFMTQPVHGAQARNIELFDVPAAGTLLKGEVRGDIKLYPGGGILTRLYVGIFDRLMIGGAFNVINVIGTGDIHVVLPLKFLGKIRITDDEGPVPAIALGYEGEGYFGVPPKGVFLAVSKEAGIGPVFVQLTGAIHTNQFAEFGREVDMGAGMAFAVTREFTANLEYDGIFRGDRGFINGSLAYFFDPIEIAVAAKYRIGQEDMRLSRILKILYISYF